MSKKNKLPPRLIAVYGQPNKMMREDRALKAERNGRCIIHNGAVHFYETISDAGYNSGSKILKWIGKKSGYAGPQVLQCIKC